MQVIDSREMFEEVHATTGTVGKDAWHPFHQDAWHREFLEASVNCIWEAQHPPQHLAMCPSSMLLQADKVVRFPQESILEMTTRKYITASTVLRWAAVPFWRIRASR